MGWAEEAQRLRGGSRSAWLHTEDMAGEGKGLMKDVCEAMLGR